MTPNRRRTRYDLGTFLLAAGMAILAQGCATPPEPPGHAGQVDAAPALSCADLLAEIARTEQARSAAAEQSGTAWKAVVPVVVVARKASGSMAVRDADQRLAILKADARRCETS